MDIPKDFLSKEFLSQFKTQDDTEAFMSDLHVQVYEQMLQSEMDSHLGYEKSSKAGFNIGNSRNDSYPKKIQDKHGGKNRTLDNLQRLFRTSQKNFIK